MQSKALIIAAAIALFAFVRAEDKGAESNAVEASGEGAEGNMAEGEENNAFFYDMNDYEEGDNHEFEFDEE